MGEHRAPISRNELKHYIWLCLDHIREYNAAWDYYAGMSEAEIEAHRRADATWQRPSWPFGAYAQNGQDPEIKDNFGFFDDNKEREHASSQGSRRSPGWAPETPEQQALAELDLSPPVMAEAVRARYRELVKTLHPDANGGDKQAEERLKSVNQANTTLKNSDWLSWPTR